MEKENLKNKNSNIIQKYNDSIYRLAGGIALIFAVPVFVGAFIGTKLDTKYLTGHRYTLICLAVAFIFSWALFFRIYYKIINPRDNGDKNNFK